MHGFGDVNDPCTHLVPVSVRIVQEALWEASYTAGFPNPGPVTGLWNDSTRRALSAFARDTANMPQSPLAGHCRGSSLRDVNNSIGSPLVMVPLAAMSAMTSAAGTWRARRINTSSATPNTPVEPAVVSTPVEPADLPMGLDVPDLAPLTRAVGLGAAGLLGIGVLGLAAGGLGIWYFTRKRRR